MERIYLDNAATTRVRPEAVQAALPIMTEIYGNPSSISLLWPVRRRRRWKRPAVRWRRPSAQSQRRSIFTAGGSRIG